MKFKNLELLSRWTVIKTVDEAMFLGNATFHNIIATIIVTFTTKEE